MGVRIPCYCALIPHLLQPHDSHETTMLGPLSVPDLNHAQPGRDLEALRQDAEWKGAQGM